MYDSHRLRGWNRFTGGSLVTFASILVRLQAEREVGDHVSASFNKFMPCMILPAARVTPFYRRLSSDVCVDVGSPPSEKGSCWLCFGVFQQIYAVYDVRRLRGWNRFTGGSLVTFASILVRLQAKREIGGYDLASFNKFGLYVILAGCAGGTVFPAAL